MKGLAAVAIVVAFAATSCAGLSRNRSEQATPVPTVRVGAGVPSSFREDEAFRAATEPPKTAQPTSFVLRVEDEFQMHPADIPVKMSGPVDRSYSTDERGEISGIVPTGIYQFAIPDGCAKEVIVQDGGSARVGIVEGKTVRGKLLVLWRHRYGPDSPVHATASSSWKVGQTVEVSFAITDRCGRTVAAGRPFSTFRYDLSPALEIVGKPTLRANDKGRASVRVRCTKPGDIALDLRDRDNRRDTFDLIQHLIGFDGRVPRCT